MITINATGVFDKEKGTFAVSLDLAGHTELEHEMLLAMIGSGRTVSLSPTHDGEELSAGFSIYDPAAFDLAVHNLENRHRIADGRPTLEQEAEAAANQKKYQAQAETDAKASAEKAAKDQQDSRDRIEKLAAQEIADRTLAARATAPTPAAPAATEDKPKAKEPDKVQ